MGLAQEFKEFAMKGNVIDLAVGVVIGTAFGKIVSSLVADVIMPPIGKVVGGVNFADLAVNLGAGPDGQPVLLKYGVFLQTLFDFLLIALALFMAIRLINRLKRPSVAVPVPPTKSEALLQEIRDLLEQQGRPPR